jgi:hypothetical protein
MTIARDIGILNERRELMERQADFIQVAKLLLASGGKLGEAEKLAARTPRISERVQRILSEPRNFGPALVPVTKAAVSPQVLSGSPLADYALAAANFASALASIGIYDRLHQNGMVRLPLQLVTTGAISVGATAAVVSETSIKPISRLTITSSTATPRKAAGIIVISRELARASESANRYADRSRVARCLRESDRRKLSCDRGHRRFGNHSFGIEC